MSTLDISASAKIGGCPITYVLLENNEAEIRFHGALPGWGLDLQLTENGLRRLMNICADILHTMEVEERTTDVIQPAYAVAETHGGKR